MGWSGGTFTRARDWQADEAGAIDMEAVNFDQEDDNFEAGINNCLTKDGQNSPTANLPMGTNRHTGVGNAAARDDYASAADVMDQDLIYYVDSGAADAYVITPSPAITAYEEGQRFVFRATNANTGASTLNVNALGATAIQTNDAQALLANMIVVGGVYEVTYDANGSRFVLTSPHSLAEDLNDIAALAKTDGNFIVGDGTNWVAESGATARTSLGLTIGTNVQAFDAHLEDIAAVSSPTGADEFLVSTGAGAYALESGATVRTSLGLGALATLGTVDDSNWSGTDLAVANGGTGASDAATARTNLAAAANTLSGVDFTGLTALEGNALATTDDFLVMDGTTAKRIEYTDGGIPVQTIAGTTDTIATADMNQWHRHTAATAVAVTLNTGVGKVGNYFFVQQQGAGQVTVSGTATFESAIGEKTRTTSSVLTFFCVAANTWAVYGDMAA